MLCDTEAVELPTLRAELMHVQVVKLGEGTYGEAFKAGGVVFKLVPMEGDNLINGWPQKKAGDLLAEAIIASTLSGLAEECDAAGAVQTACGAVWLGLNCPVECVLLILLL